MITFHSFLYSELFWILRISTTFVIFSGQHLPSLFIECLRCLVFELWMSFEICLFPLLCFLYLLYTWMFYLKTMTFYSECHEFWLIFLMFELLFVYKLFKLYIPFLWLGTTHCHCRLITMVISDVRWMWILDLPVSWINSLIIWRKILLFLFLLCELGII